ncbi:MAG: cytochrome c biogenesis protein CcdA [Pseudonocardia sp.]
MTGLTEFVISGPLLVAALLAMAAGAVSFASPCCLPLVPGYLAYLTSIAASPQARPAPTANAAATANAVTESPGTPAGPIPSAPSRRRLVGGGTVQRRVHSGVHRRGHEHAGIVGSAGAQRGAAAARRGCGHLAYGLGLGLPFIALALGAGWALRATDWLRRHSRAIQLTGGVLLVGIGMLLVTGLWGEFIASLRAPIGGFTTPL